MTRSQHPAPVQVLKRQRDNALAALAVEKTRAESAEAALTTQGNEMRELRDRLAVEKSRAETAERQFGELSEANLQLIDQTNAAMARVAALAANVALSEALSDCMNSLQESNFCFKPGCCADAAEARDERIRAEERVKWGAELRQAALEEAARHVELNWTLDRPERGLTTPAGERARRLSAEIRALAKGETP